MRKARPPRPTEPVQLRLFSDAFDRLCEEASRRGLPAAEAINQAIDLWLKIAEEEGMTQDRKVYVCLEASPAWWQRLLLKWGIQTVNRRVKVCLTATFPGESVDMKLGRHLIE